MNELENTITVKELRALLLNLENQNMTVRELRVMLFNVDEQNMKLNNSIAVFKRIERDYEATK